MLSLHRHAYVEAPRDRAHHAPQPWTWRELEALARRQARGEAIPSRYDVAARRRLVSPACLRAAYGSTMGPHGASVADRRQG